MGLAVAVEPMEILESEIYGIRTAFKQVQYDGNVF